MGYLAKIMVGPQRATFYMLLMFKLAESKYFDVCMQKAERVNLQCGRGEIIQVNWAKYGRMRTGRCIKLEQNIGCETDVLFLMDRWCSGKKNCAVAIPNQDIVEANQCSNDLLMFLEYDMDCLKVAEADGSRCKRDRRYQSGTTSGTLASMVVDESGCGTKQAPWIIEGAPGQRVNISMLDFVYTPTSSGAKASTMTCEPYGYIVERKLGINRTVCGGVARRRHVYMSASSLVEIYVSKAAMRAQDSAFIMEYKVIGCPDARPPEHAWYKRMGDTAEMGCEWSDLSWQMKCVDNHWKGKMGNCSVIKTSEVASAKDTFAIHPVLSMGLIIGLAVLIAVLVCVIGIGFYCMKRQKPSAPSNPTAMTLDKQESHHVQATIARGTYKTESHRAMLTGHPHHYIPGTAGGATNNDLLHGLGTATLKRGQPNSGESEYLAPCLTGSYLAEKYGAPIYDTVGTRNGTGERNSSAGDGDWVQEANFQFLTAKA